MTPPAYELDQQQDAEDEIFFELPRELPPADPRVAHTLIAHGVGLTAGIEEVPLPDDPERAGTNG